MKKIMSLLISLILMFSLFGCGGKTAVTEKEIYVAAFSGAYGEEYWKSIKTEFEELYKAEGYKVKIVASPTIEDTVRAQIQAKRGPDVMYLPVGQKKGVTEGLLKSKSIEDITSILSEKVPGEDVILKDKIIPGFVNNMSTDPYNDGKTYMMPMLYSPVGMFYNKALFNEDGTGDKYKLPTTWDEFLALKTELDVYNASHLWAQRQLMVYPTSGYMTEFIYSTIASATDTTTLNNFMNYENVYDDSKVKEALSLFGQLKGYVADSSYTGTQYKDTQKILLRNEALFMPCGTWLPNEMEDFIPAEGFEYGFTAPFKFKEDSKRYAYAKLEQAYILKQSKKKDIAKKFLAFLYSDKAVKIIADTANGIVPTINALELAKDTKMNKSTMEFYKIFDGGNITAISGSFASANLEGVNWTDTFTGNVNEIMKDAKTTSAWIQEMKVASTQLKAAIVK